MSLETAVDEVIKLSAEVRRLHPEVRRLQKLIDDCAPYLNDGETPAEALKRLQPRVYSSTDCTCLTPGGPDYCLVHAA